MKRCVNEDLISKQYSKTVEMNLIIALFFVPLISANPLTRLGKNEPPIINIPLVTFNGDTSTTFKFHELNDPVMVRVTYVYIYISFAERINFFHLKVCKFD